MMNVFGYILCLTFVLINVYYCTDTNLVFSVIECIQIDVLQGRKCVHSRNCMDDGACFEHMNRMIERKKNIINSLKLIYRRPGSIAS